MENLENAPETPEKKSRKKTTIPQTQYDLQNTAQNVLNKWKDSPHITLIWTNVKEFSELVKELNVNLGERADVGSKRATQTQELNTLDQEINKAVEQIKIALYNKFGKEKGKAHFASFGIVKQNGQAYKLPPDRNQRVNALLVLAKACLEYEIETVDYKKEFFANISEQYQEAYNKAQATDSTVAINVGNKNDVLQKIKSILSAIVLLIKANYPNTYQNELRGWGFQKEKY